MYYKIIVKPGLAMVDRTETTIDHEYVLTHGQIHGQNKSWTRVEIDGIFYQVENENVVFRRFSQNGDLLSEELYKHYV